MPLAATAAPPDSRPLDWMNISFLVISPLIAVIGTAWYTWENGVTWLEIANFFLMFYCTGIGITGGYHRYYSHRTYDCSKPVQLFYLLFGAAAIQNSVLKWCSDHRYHHRFVDTDEDPYNILRGGLYAHVGWILRRETRPPLTRFKNIPDLLKDPLVRWQDRYYLPIIVVVSFLLPTLIGLLEGRPMGGLLWGGLMRIVIVHHMTFFINSLAHLYGVRPYSTANTGRDNWMLGPFTFGEGYHNFHHAFQYDFRNGFRWYQFDLAKWIILGLERLGLVWNVRRAPEALILRARLTVDMEKVQERLGAVAAPMGVLGELSLQMARLRERVESSMASYQDALRDYRAQKNAWSADMRAAMRQRVDRSKTEFEDFRRRWMETVKTLHRLPQPSAQSLLTLTAVLDVLKHKL